MSEKDTEEAFLNFTHARKNLVPLLSPVKPQDVELINIHYTLDPALRWHLHGQVYKYVIPSLESVNKETGVPQTMVCIPS